MRSGQGFESVEAGDLLNAFLERNDLEAREELAVNLYKIAYQQAASHAAGIGLRWSREDFEDFAQDCVAEIFRNDAAWLRSLRYKTTGGLIHMTVLLSASRMIDARRSVDERERDKTGPMERPGTDGSDSISLHDILPDSADTPRGQLLYRELIAAVRRARVESVTNEERGVVLDLWCLGYKYREIAVLLDLPEGTVGTHVHRGIADVAAHLAKEGFQS